MGALQPWHLIVILVIVLMVFGPGKLPDLGRSLGEGMRELKKASADVSADSLASAPAASSTTGERCSACGSAVASRTRFCGYCGQEVRRAGAHTA